MGNAYKSDGYETSSTRVVERIDYSKVAIDERVELERMKESRKKERRREKRGKTTNN